MPVLTKEQEDVIFEFLRRGASEDLLLRGLGWTGHDVRGQLLTLLTRATRERDATGVDWALKLCIRFGVSSAFRDVLIEVLRAEWHTEQEDAVDILAGFREAAVVPVLFEVAQRRYPNRGWDDGRALERKCMFALRDMGRKDAVERLIDLTSSSDPFIVKEATARLRELAARDSSSELTMMARAALGVSHQ
jgi:hypothetical protein